MANIKFIYFEGCPNAQVVRDSLQELGVVFEEVDQGSIPPGSPYRKYTSPTILNGSELVVGAHSDEGGGCSLDIPSANDLKRMLKAIK